MTTYRVFWLALFILVTTLAGTPLAQEINFESPPFTRSHCRLPATGSTWFTPPITGWWSSI